MESTQIRAVSVSDFFNFPTQKSWNLESMALTEAVSYPWLEHSDFLRTANWRTEYLERKKQEPEKTKKGNVLVLKIKHLEGNV